jgi:hypothetical protein
MIRLATTLAVLLCCAAPVAADEVVLVKPRSRWLVHGNAAVNLYSYVGPITKGTAGTQISPDDRLGLGEQVGVGYFVHPNVNIRLTFQLSETLAGRPAGTSPFQLFGTMAWVVYTTHGFFAGIGPMLDFVTYGKPHIDAGFYASTGYVFDLGHGLGLGPALNLITAFVQRNYVALNQVATLVYRF